MTSDNPENALQRTALHDTHVSSGGRMVPFGGWDMPVQYPSGILAEVKAVRTATGVFDVSHMGRLYISGPKATEFLDWVLTGSASTLRVGRARYCLICNEQGGVFDDTIFYRLAEDRYLLIPNAGNRPTVVAWFERWIEDRFPLGCNMDDVTESTGLIAFQGPGTLAAIDELADKPLSKIRPFSWTEGAINGAPVFAGRTGYTGEDGFEFMVQGPDIVKVWTTLTDSGAVPCGLGARDVLRLEAGLPLHGHEIDENITPIEAGLDRFVRPDGEYVGSGILRGQRENGVTRKLIGFTLPGRSAPRAGYALLHQGETIGSVTSGSYSPTLDTSIGMGYVLERYAETGATLDLDIRGRTSQVTIAELPFYKRSRNS
ncbi:MAG: glycine cleavage system aminomethyltransferase GcvT [Chloroflexi bacterium]|nr:glycine cleavage system aminomethyltransferase GcvT [Chloroflexota bacterium]MDA1271287.1 glycine cleavage system aminomethyltransferase GcvT [Chloroflexota bacterium]PKB58176.1 MAG: glycine cleavage system protein T [SAR202 cluster bacterium Casp-Chloro-G2]